LRDYPGKDYTHPLMDLVLDIGNFRVKGAVFQDDQLVEAFRLPLDLMVLEHE